MALDSSRRRLGTPDAWDRKKGSVSASDTLELALSERGGFVTLFKR